VIVRLLRIQIVSVCLSTVFLFTAGCIQQPSIAATAAPDGTAEIIEIGVDGEINHVEANFSDAVIRKDDKLVLVDFWAEWCGPCLRLAPELESVKQDWGDRLVLVKVDVDHNPELAAHFEVSSIPDVRIFRNGEPLGGFMGYTDGNTMSARLKSLE